MRSMPWLDADLAQIRTLDSGESPSCFFMLFTVNFLFLFLHEPMDWQWLMTILVSLSGNSFQLFAVSRNEMKQLMERVISCAFTVSSSG
jgi:hypothetical protein